VELNIPTLPTRSSNFRFFEGDDNIVCLHCLRWVTLSLHVSPKHHTVSEWVQRAHGKSLPVTLASCWGKAPARRFPLAALPFQRAPAQFINRLTWLNERKRLQICGRLSGLRLLSVMCQSQGGRVGNNLTLELHSCL